MNSIENQPDIDKIYLSTKDLYEAKYQYLINKREGVDIDHFNDPKTFIEYSNDMGDVYKNIGEYNPDKENKILIVVDDMIADMIHNKKLDSVVTELFIRGRKSDISNLYRNYNIYRECTVEPYSFFVNDTTLASDNPLRLRKLFLKYNKNHDN